MWCHFITNQHSTNMQFKDAMKAIKTLKVMAEVFPETVKINIPKVPRVSTGGGFMVSFERIQGGFLHGDHFPAKHDKEALIRDEETAWQLARLFAMATKGVTCNIYVTEYNFSPVRGYNDKKITNR